MSIDPKTVRGQGVRHILLVKQPNNEPDPRQFSGMLGESRRDYVMLNHPWYAPADLAAGHCEVTRRDLLRRGAASALISVPSWFLAGEAEGETSGERIQFHRDDAVGQMQIALDGTQALTYCYGDDVDLPHYYPVRSPSGRLLTVQKAEPYPHHRSIWFADTVALAGQRKVSFYNALYSRAEPKDPTSPFRDRVRHVQFLPHQVEADRGEIGMKLLWEMDRKTSVLDETRRLDIVAFGRGEYLADMQFTLTAAYGDVAFQSDATHYAWPFVRMHPDFSVSRGATLTNSEGGVGQAATHNQAARWVDYSKSFNGEFEGLALFSHPGSGPPPRWLTRDYGTFGPRRADQQSGKPFTLPRGKSLTQRVGLFVHRGDVTSSRLAERYQSYAAEDGR